MVPLRGDGYLSAVCAANTTLHTRHAAHVTTRTLVARTRTLRLANRYVWIITLSNSVPEIVYLPVALLHSHMNDGILLWVGHMSEKTEVWQGTLALMVLKTLEVLGPLHGYGIARRIEQTSANHLVVNYGTLYPALLKLEQEGYVASEWGVSEHNRKAKFYRLTRAGRKQLERETRDWERTTEIVARFLASGSES